ncbi:DgyrCDS5257 [Dimorphilus gyrociliatus]|uniref:guanylate cyclase n=1 Tax=Dimorphilus gyrociliatus TaxID=2664684 RepID=A0A7I8VM12_9ANNE|nr:DgyrCDS5257 [Dimorphilus gyrociliatus]
MAFFLCCRRRFKTQVGVLIPAKIAYNEDKPEGDVPEDTKFGWMACKDDEETKEGDQLQLSTLQKTVASIVQPSLNDNETAEEYCKNFVTEHKQRIRSIGCSIRQLISNLNGLRPSKSSCSNSFVCFNHDSDGSFYVRANFIEEKLSTFYQQFFIHLATFVFGEEIDMKIAEDKETVVVYRVTCKNRPKDNTPSKLDYPIDMATMCEILPFHLMLNKDLLIEQLGSALSRILQLHDFQHQVHFAKYFSIVQPQIDMIIPQTIASNTNVPFEIQLRFGSQSHLNFNSENGLAVVAQKLKLKGQFLFVEECDSYLFLGSPVVAGLDQLIGNGIFISDVPIHDATRDVILVGEQSKAQDGLKKRMERLNAEVEEACKAVEVEKEKNVELLNLIFPENIAKELWLGNEVVPSNLEDVTMLFSDLVGFTSICSTATPFQVIRMLSALYTLCDAACEKLDIYKIETIGDAYCVAGGLHKTSKYHAQQICWMALEMLNAAGKVKTHDSRPIRMRIGVHSGPVMAGVVGKKMPRYCLFGNNVTLANKFESGSEAMKTNVSPTTYRLVENTKGFSFVPRRKEDLPKGFPAGEGIGYFLQSYKHSTVSDESCIELHTEAAMKEYFPIS